MQIPMKKERQRFLMIATGNPQKKDFYADNKDALQSYIRIIMQAWLVST